MKLFKRNNSQEKTECFNTNAGICADQTGEEDNESYDAEGKCADKSKIEVDTLNPLSCFGMKKDRTENWIEKCVKIWYYVMSFLWFLFGAFTFAPVIFIANKMEAIFKDKLKSLVVGAIIYTVIVALIVILFATRNSDKIAEVEQIVS